MPVDTIHPDQAAMKDRWADIRDALSGSHQVKTRGRHHMRVPEGLDAGQAAAYIRNASWFSASSRSLDGLAGAVLRKAPLVTVPDAVEPWLAAVTATGTPFSVFAGQVVRETIAMGRCGVLVDVNADGRVQLGLYTAESVVNWRLQTVEGKPTLSLLVLKEGHDEADDQDEFMSHQVAQYRVLRLVRDAAERNLAVEVTVWRRADSGEFEAVVGPLVLRRRGEALSRIPFVFFGADNLDASVGDPPLEGLVEMNYSHFQTSAELEHCAWYVACPVYVISGKMQAADDTAELRVGATSAWILEQGADAKILTVGPDGLGALERRLETKARMMAVLGARLLEQPKAGVESADAVNLRHRGERSLLATIAATVERGLTRVLSIASRWMTGIEDGATVQLNRDFATAAMTPAEVVQMVAAFQSGGIGAEVLFFNLKAGERLPETMTTLDDFEADLEMHGASAGFLGFTGDNDDDETEDEEAA